MNVTFTFYSIMVFIEEYYIYPMYHRLQNKCCLQRCQIIKKMQLTAAICNKFDLCYYEQVNSLRLKSRLASKWTSIHLGGTIYFGWLCYIHTNLTEEMKKNPGSVYKLISVFIR